MGPVRRGSRRTRAAITCGAGAASSKRRSATRPFTWRPRTPARIVGILPLAIFRSRLFGNFAVSLPFVDGGGVLCHQTTVSSRAVDAIAPRRWPPAVVVACGTASRLAPAARAARAAAQGRHDPAARARPRQGVGRLLDRKVRNQVRKAEKSALVERRGGVELLDAFYDVFAATCATSARRCTRDVSSSESSRRLRIRRRCSSSRISSALPWPPPSASCIDRPSRCHGRRHCASSAAQSPNSLLVLEDDRARHRVGIDDASISAGRRPAKAPITSRNSGARARHRCTGNTSSRRDGRSRISPPRIRSFAPPSPPGSGCRCQ